MAKVQKRRTVSVTGPTYRRFRTYAYSQGRSVSSMIEDFMIALAGDLDDPGPTEPKHPPKPTFDEIVSAHFTF